jgi:phospholipid/cholesterol/gamma-HCH transport system permease protein
MNRGADFTYEPSDGKATIRFSGRLTLARMGDLPQRLALLGGYAADGEARDDEKIAKVDTIDLSEVERVDTVGAWIIHRIKRDYGATIEGGKPDVVKLLGEIEKADQKVQIRPDKTNAFSEMLATAGHATRSAGASLVGMIGFFGAMMVGIGGIIRNPRRFRVNAVVQRFEVVGINALAIIGLMSFLIGIVIAQQGATQLEQFGMEVFTINLVGRSAMRELGVLMTAIMVAGRSGSAFAAQLGTMKLTEEIDAMRTIGVSPMEALVLPRVLATTIMMPLLGFYAGVVAVIGGMIFVWVGLDIPPITYLQRIREVVPMTDVSIGLIKAPVFGFIIGLTGCYQGMQVEANAEEVGLRTTSAVVQGIFMVIVLDAIFAVFFTGLGWK